MEFIIAEEGVPINLGPDGGSIAYFGSEIAVSYTQLTLPTIYSV